MNPDPVSTPGPVPDRYREAVGSDDPMIAMSETPDRLRKLVRGLSAKQLATKPAPEKWSIKEIVAHLADGEVILGSRYRFIAAHDRPPIQGYDQDGVHSERREESIRKLMTMYAGHDRIHMQQIETIRVGLFPGAARKKA